MSKRYSVKFTAAFVECESKSPRMAVVADLNQAEAEELLIDLADELGYARIWELLETELKEAAAGPMGGEEGWNAPQDPGHTRAMKWPGSHRGG